MDEPKNMPNETAVANPETMEDIGKASQGIVDKTKLESFQFLNPATWQAMTIAAKVFLNSGSMPNNLDTIPKIMVVLQAGKESGLQPLEAINSYYFVNGKVTIYGEMKIALVRRAGHSIDWGDCDENSATVTITRRDTKEKMTGSFTIAKAKSRGLTNKDVWQKYPENMLKFKAFDQVARFLVPDALHGSMSESEVIEREAIEAEVVPQDDKKKDEKPEKETKTPEASATVTPEGKTLDKALKEKDPPTEKESKPEKKDEPKSKARQGMERGMKDSENKK